jgi:hypothetical protein
MPNTILKRWNPALNGGLGGFEELYPKTTVGQISASGTPSNTTFLRGDGQWVVPTDTGVTGSGTANLLTYWTGSNTIGSLSTGTYPSLTELSYVKGLSSAAQTQLTNRIPYGDVLMPTNPFGGKALYINSLDNALYAADKKWYVTATIHSKTYLSEAYPKLNPDYYGIYTTTTSNNTTFTITQTPKPSNVVVYSNISGGGTIMTQVVSAPSGNTQYSYNNSTGVITFGAARPDSTIYVYPGPEVRQYLDSPVESTPNAATLFNGDYESNIAVAAGKYLKVKVTPGNNDYTTFAGFFTYTYGTFYGSYYYDSAVENAYLRTYNYGFPGQTIGWKFQTFSNFIGTNTDASYINSVYNGGDIYRSVMEFIFVAKDAKAAGVSQIDWRLDRPTLSATGATVTKFGTNKLYDILNIGNQTSNNIILNPNGVVTLGSGNVVLTGSSGNVTSYGSFIGGNVRAIASAEAALVNLATGTTISRNIADANPSLVVNNVHASSTANLLDLQASGTNVISFKRDGTLLAPATFTIDPSAHGNATGKVIILGDLQVDGTTTTINSTTLEVDDKNIELSKGAANKAASDGAGITVDLGTDGTASLLYGSTADKFTVNKSIDVTGNILSAPTSTTGQISLGDTSSYLKRDNSFDLSLGQNSDSSGVLYATSRGDVVVNIDADNNGTTNKFVVRKDTLKTGGTDLLTVLESGNIGIGTASPGQTLDVNGAITTQTYFNVDNTTSSRTKIKLFADESDYAIGMQNGITFGGLNDWSMTFQFNNDNSRGFWWGDTVHTAAQGAMALTTNGLLTVASGVRVGYGESDTTTPTANLIDVSGNVSATRLISTETTIAPLSIASQVAVTNLNADLLDGNHAADFLLTSSIKEQLKYLYIYGKAQSAITKGQAVQFAGIQGDHILIKAAVPSEINANPDYFIGLAEATLATDDFGYVLTQGELINVNTSTYTAGILWFASAGSTAGALTATEPTGTNAKIQVGAVTKVNASSGIILTRMHIFGVEIADISASGTPSNTTFLRGDGAWATPAGGGSVTSVTGTTPIVSSGGNTPAISLAASYGDTQNPYASKTAKNFLAAPNAANGVPTFRAMVASDLPSIGNITNAGGFNNSPQAIASGNSFAIVQSGLLSHSSLQFGSGTATFLRNDGTWGTPAGVATDAIAFLNTSTSRQDTTYTTAFSTGTLDANAWYEVEFNIQYYKTATSSTRSQHFAIIVDNTTGTPTLNLTGSTGILSGVSGLVITSALTSNGTGNTITNTSALTGAYDRVITASGIFYTGTSTKVISWQDRAASTLSGSEFVGTSKGSFIRTRKII